MDTRGLADITAGTGARRWIVLGVLLAAVLTWWWWPSISGASADTDVVIVGDSFLRGAETEISERVHEDGFSVDWMGDAAADGTLTWCDAAAAVRAAVERDDPAFVVVSFSSEGSCGADPMALRADVADAAGSAGLIVVAAPSSPSSAIGPPGSTVVDTMRLLGSTDTLQQNCLWFDICQPGGSVAVREADGALTPSGQTRVARLIVTALRS